MRGRGIRKGKESLEEPQKGVESSKETREDKRIQERKGIIRGIKKGVESNKERREDEGKQERKLGGK